MPNSATQVSFTDPITLSEYILSKDQKDGTWRVIDKEREEELPLSDFVFYIPVPDPREVEVDSSSLFLRVLEKEHEGKKTVDQITFCPETRYQQYIQIPEENLSCYLNRNEKKEFPIQLEKEDVVSLSGERGLKAEDSSFNSELHRISKPFSGSNQEANQEAYTGFDKKVNGTVLGAVIGFVVGGALGGAPGALIGMAVGCAIGYCIAHFLSKSPSSSRDESTATMIRDSIDSGSQVDEPEPM